MHATFFGIKRWHLRIVETSKKLLQPDGLTPARFDLMRAIAARGGEIRQRSLQYLLGVSGVTISRMLKGLEEKGFVVRSRLGRDRRFKNVCITATGDQALRRDLAYCVDSRINEILAAALVTGDRYANIDSVTVRRRVENTTDHLVFGRRILCDRSPVRHPWSGGDFAALASVALEHAENPHPLRRRRRPIRDGAPMAWEIPPPPRPRPAKARRRARSGRARVHADLFFEFDSREEAERDRRARAQRDGRA